MAEKYKNTLRDFLGNKKIIKYSVYYTLMIGAVNIAHKIADTYFARDEIPGMIAVIYAALSFCIFDIAEFALMLSFAYMIIHGKWKFKRFFGFFSPKYFCFNIAYSVIFGVIPGIINVLWVRYYNYTSLVYDYYSSLSPVEGIDGYREKLLIGRTLAVLSFILFVVSFIYSSIGYLIIYFKASAHKDGFIKVTKNTAGFLRKNFRRYFVFMLPPALVRSALIRVITHLTEYTELLECFGYFIDIFFVPYIFLCIGSFFGTDKTAEG